MSYATKQDLIDRYGEAEITQISGGGGVGVPDNDVIDRALADADTEIDAYLVGRYTLPLVPQPKMLTLVACDIARYRLFGARATEEVEKRYKNQVEFLRQVAAGKVAFGLNAAGQPTPTSGGPSSCAPERVFTRDSLEDY